MIRDDIFWHTVKEHYIEKKKKLMSCTDIESEEYIKDIKKILKNYDLDITYLDKLKSMTTIEELEEEYKKFEDDDFDINDYANDTYDFSNEPNKYLFIYIDLLIVQLTPLLPPFTEDEIKVQIKYLKDIGLVLPPDMYDYFTKVSRELLIFNDSPLVIKNFDEQIFNVDYLKNNPDYDKQYNGFNIGSSGLNKAGHDLCASKDKYVYLKQGELCSSVWVDLDDGYDQDCPIDCPMFTLYAMSFSDLIEKRMKKENKGDYDRDSNLYTAEFYMDSDSDNSSDSDSDE